MSDDDTPWQDRPPDEQHPPELIAALDQLKAGLPLMAEASMAIYRAYRAVGFSDEQAFEVVCTHLRPLLALGTGEDE